jgi:hypothetical protein
VIAADGPKLEPDGPTRRLGTATSGNKLKQIKGNSMIDHYIKFDFYGYITLSKAKIRPMFPTQQAIT